MAKPQNAIHVEFIKNLLRKGGKRVDIVAKFGKRWQKVSIRTFDRRLKEAEELLKAEHAHIQFKAEQKVVKAIELLEMDIMGVVERKNILTQIARGEIPLSKPLVIDKEIRYLDVVPDYTDRKNAIAELNKMDGAYQPTKIANTNPDGTPVAPATTTTVIINGK